MMIIPALAEYYVVIINKGSAPDFTVSTTELPIIAFSYDDSVSPPALTPITVSGPLVARFIAHPSTRYVDVATNQVWDDEASFVESMQEAYDVQRAVAVTV